MQDPFVFGYGSLVNRATHSAEGAHPARVRGWRRVWRRATMRPYAFLTVERHEEIEIDGLIAPVASGDWAALDAREAAYDRHPAKATAHPLPDPPVVHIYAIPEGAHEAPHTDAPVLLSYVDTVVQGFLNEFGADGVSRFFDTTGGWDAPILDDRDGPVYVRAVTLSGSERRLVDLHLDEQSAVRFRKG